VQPQQLSTLLHLPIHRSSSLSRKSATIFDQGTIPEPSTPHIDKEVALVARTAAFVDIYARISQIAEMHTSLYATLFFQVLLGIASGILIGSCARASLRCAACRIVIID
jgi:hypothetical protein